MERFAQILHKLIPDGYRSGRTARALACVVVFIVTYMLILPAFTLDRDEAAEQGGIDVPEAAAEELAEETPEPEAHEDADDTITAQERNETLTELTCEGEGYTFSIEDPGEAVTDNADTALDVREITEQNDSKLYAQLCDDVLAALDEEGKQLGFARFYDISLISDGQEIEPEAAIDIKVSYDKTVSDELRADDAGKVKVVHFVEDRRTGTVSPQIIDDSDVDVTLKKGCVTEAEFSTDSLSIFAVVYTVDFNYEIDGTQYDFSIPGGGFVSLGQMAEMLGIAGKVSETAEKFVAEVESVEFSSPDLVSVSKIEEDTTVGAIKKALGLECEYSAELTDEDITEINSQTIKSGDWALISLKAFNTDETLTITMKNGEQLVVQVTDAQISTHVITADGEDYIITVTYGPEAGIPDGATLEAEELLPGTEEYEDHFSMALAKLREDSLHADESAENADDIFTLYPDAEAAIITPSDETNLLFARFFDISILSDGREIEPKAPVSVSVSYEEPIDMQEGIEAEIIHFADEATELLPAVTDSPNEDQNNQISTFEFSQESFSVTGTMLKYTGSVASGKYIIVVSSGGNYYALNSSGGTTQVTRNSDNVTFANVPDDCQWEITKVDDNGTYTIKNGSNNLVLYNSSVVGNWTQNITIIPNDITTDSNGKQSGRNRVTLKNSGVSTYLGWSNSNFAAINKAQQVYLARVNTDITKQGKDEIPVAETDLGDLAAWKNRITSSKLEVDKTAQVSDFNNRIYQVDITASSNVYAIQPSIDLELIVDTSRSMFFPATLNPVPDTLYNSVRGLINLANGGKLDKNKVYYFIGGGEQATVYALYYGKSSLNLNDDADAAKWRYVDASYMNPPDGTEQSYNDWLNKMEGRNIEDFGVNSETLNYPENRNGSYFGRLYTSPDDISRFAYLKEAIRIASEIVYEIDENARIGLVTFNKDASPKGFYGKDDDLKSAIGAITLAGGTQQDKGLSVGQTMFSNNSRTGAQKIAVLITDGAPNQTNWQNITTAANNLKNSGVTLYTLGLSMTMVGGNNAANLAGIVTTGDGVTRSYAAESGPEIVSAVKNLIETLVRKADTESTITDKIDQAYYPVAKDGRVLQDGDYIAMDGSYLDQKPASGVDYGQITYDGKTYGVRWEKQRIHFEDENSGEDGWHGIFYVKAKEDFLGGNHVKTNSDTESDKVLVEKLIVTDPVTHKESSISLTTDKQISVPLDTPIVNVKELSLSSHDATWTLYLGSEVTDAEIKKQISNLFDAIDVSELVTAEGKIITSSEDKPATFLLKTLVGGSLTDKELTDLLEGKTVSRQYDHYGHTDVGTVKITLKKETNSDGDTVYKLTATYSADQPSGPASGEDWHNGPNGPGRAMNSISSDNTQTIENYYLPQAFQVKKVDSEGKAITTSPAMFKLYRAAKEGETGVSLANYDENLNAEDGYFLIDTVHTDSATGIARIGSLKDAQGNNKDASLLLNAADGPYYLIETGAPMGYTREKTPTTITVTAGPNRYVDLEGNEIQVGKDASGNVILPSVPYNMTQGVTVTVSGNAVSQNAAQETVTIVDGTGNPKTLTDNRTYLLETDSNTTYQTAIINNSITEEGGVDQDPSVKQKKQIDYLGDLAGNSDTGVDDAAITAKDKSSVQDLYRLYLDATLERTPKDANILIAIDNSSSMESETLGETTRMAALKDALTGQNGFVNTLLAEGSGNQLSVVRFSDKANTSVIQDWTAVPGTATASINSSYTASSGNVSNYDHMLDAVDGQLSKIASDRKDKPTYVIVISDSIPTAYLNKTSDEVGGYESITNPPAGLTSNMVNGLEVIENLNIVLPNSIDAIGDFRANPDHKDINIRTIGIGAGMDSTLNPNHALDGSLEAFQYGDKKYNFVLEYLGRSGCETVTEKSKLLDALMNSIETVKLSKLQISDTLSDYVNLYTAQPDFVVSKQVYGGNPVNLTTQYNESTGTYKVLNGETEIGTIEISGKTVTLKFKDDLDYEHGDKYTISFNVETTQKAYTDYTANKAQSGNNGYGNITGDKDTDYKTNTTSSEKPGFYSNAVATLSYEVKGEAKSSDYDKPVIQVGITEREIKLKKVGTNNTDKNPQLTNLGGAKFTIYREVDGKAGAVVEVDSKSLSGLTSNETTGYFYNGKLDIGTYLIRETESPAGYNALGGDIRLTITKDGITVAPAFTTGTQTAVCAVEDDKVTVHIVNVAGVSLPSTGGPGTTLLYIMGAILILTSISLTIRQRRSN